LGDTPFTHCAGKNAGHLSIFQICSLTDYTEDVKECVGQPNAFDVSKLKSLMFQG